MSRTQLQLHGAAGPEWFRAFHSTTQPHNHTYRSTAVPLCVWVCVSYPCIGYHGRVRWKPALKPFGSGTSTPNHPSRTRQTSKVRTAVAVAAPETRRRAARAPCLRVCCAVDVTRNCATTRCRLCVCCTSRARSVPHCAPHLAPSCVLLKAAVRVQADDRWHYAVGAWVGRCVRACVCGRISATRAHHGVSAPHSVSGSAALGAALPTIGRPCRERFPCRVG